MADLFPKLVEALSKLQAFLTFKFVAALAMLLLLGGLSVAFMDNRPLIYKTITLGKVTADSPLPATLNQTTQDEIKLAVDRSENIVAISITQAVLRNNARRDSFFYSDVQEFQKAYTYFIENKVTDTPLFVTGDSENNDRIIAIIEQEMVCVDLPKGTIQRVPIAAVHVKQLCSISIPPRFGRMVGYITLWMKEPIPRGAFGEYKQMMRAMSDDIYERDVDKSAG